MSDSEQNFEEPKNSLPEIELQDLPASLRQAAARAGWEKLMPVQAKSLPYLLGGRELMVQARTGSGKTGAFLLPMLEQLDPELKACQALILTPTRELAKQIAREAEVLCSEAGLESVAVYGGVGYSLQKEAFERGAQIVIGTPGRILDHLVSRNLSFAKLSMLVFDEADRMLSYGFYPDMVDLKRHLPDRPVNTYMFSATFPEHVLRLAGEFMAKPEMLSLSKSGVHASEVEHVFYEVPAMGRDRALMRILEVESPTQAMIFCNTKSNVHYVTAVLKQFGYDADELSADLSQNQRERVLSQVRDGSLRFLVATDVAGRGIDIPSLSHVVLYELPEDPESYIHRSGRTGRAGAAGTAVSLVDLVQKSELKRIAGRYEIDMVERATPSEEDIQQLVSERLTALLETQLRKRDALRRERLRRFIPLAKSLAEHEDLLPLMAMLMDDAYMEALHKPTPAPEAKRNDPADPPRQRRRSGRRKRKPRKSDDG
ncbi:MAG: ATP-dependent helicase DeaD [Desulfovibrionales bacterium]|nr:ATP-dependent helicase DeaD [Desulfovibrionales bacterium]